MSYNHIFTQALHCFDNEDYTTAEALLRQILQTSPDNPDVLNMIGLIAQIRELHHEAVSYFSAAIRQKKDNPAFYYNLAFSLKATNQYADALINFNKVLQLNPTIKEAHNEIACINEILGNNEQAILHWKTALQLDPEYITAKINLIFNQYPQNPQQTETTLLELSKNYDKEPLLWYNLTLLAINKKDWTTALDYIQKADVLTSSAEIKNLQGIIFSNMNDFSQAEQCFYQAEQLNPNHINAKLALANFMSRSNRFEAAEIRYKRIIELSPDNFDAHNNYAEMLYRQKRLAEALEEYRKAVILNPKSAEVNNNLGIILKDLDEYEEALGLFFNALSLNPKLNEISINISETLILLSAIDIDKAFSIATNWKKSYPDNIFAVHLTAALQGEDIGNDKIYTEKLFDNFADNYELVMQNLDYSAPLVMRRIAGSLEGRIVDLGCGSGLIGQAFKTDRNQIIGVDISSKMLEKAKEKNVYNELIKSDILDFLRVYSNFDWVIAADVLGYIGNLEEFISLCKGKKLLFSVETTNSNNYILQPSGRFKHNPEYIENLLRQNDFYAICKEDIILRNENGVPVEGCIFKAQGDKLNE